MLLDNKTVLEMLRCPVTGEELLCAGDTLVSKYNKDGRKYRIINKYPVLVDFTNSVLDEGDITDDLGSVVKRRSYGFIMLGVKRLVSGSSRVTTKNVDHLVKLLLKGRSSARVLIIGGGTVGGGMYALYDNPDIQTVSFDLYASPLVQFIADAHKIPLPDNYFDAVIVQAVLEHVLDPHQVVSESFRVLKADGLIYSETPFLQHVHEGAYDFTRFTESGHRYLFKQFKLIKSGVVAGSGTQLLWSLDNFSRGLFRSKMVGRLTKLCFFWLRYFDRLIPKGYNIDCASCVFFLGQKQKHTIGCDDVISHYGGRQ